MSELVVSCQRLYAGYGDVTVVRDLNLEVRDGEVVVLLGPNGAGKTTTLLTIAGLLPKLGGNVHVCGQPVSSRRPHVMASRGLAFVPDNRSLVSGLSVRDNLRIAVRKGGQSIDDVLDLFPALRTRTKLRAGQLSGGEQQMLAIGRALMLRPRVLVIDEMSMGLAPIIIELLLGTIVRIANEVHMGVLLVEQHVELALHSADRAYVLVHGDLILQSNCVDLRANPDRLTQAYLGKRDTGRSLAGANAD
jgi:branched-chain amino acid transport system ATP-binding protein